MSSSRTDFVHLWGSVMRIAIANLKGGVGKSTTTVLLAESLALFHSLRILICDLDPQSNSSYMLLSREGVELVESHQRTLLHFLASVGTSPRPNLAHFIEPSASDLRPLVDGNGYGCVDLMPSTPQMWFVETQFDRDTYLAGNIPDLKLKAFLKPHLDGLAESYDLILFDCPPGFSTLARAGILLSDVVLSPTLADAVSARSLKDFADIGLKRILRRHRTLQHYAAVTKFISNQESGRILDELRANYSVIGSPMPYSIEFVRASQRIRRNSYREFREKYGTRHNDVRRFGDEFARLFLAEMKHEQERAS